MLGQVINIALIVSLLIPFQLSKKDSTIQLNYVDSTNRVYSFNSDDLYTEKPNIESLIHRSSDKYTQILGSIKKTLQSSDNQEKTSYLLFISGLIQKNTGHYSQSKKSFKTVIDTETNYDNFLLIARSQIQLASIELAFSNPDLAKALCDEAMTYLSLLTSSDQHIRLVEGSIYNIYSQVFLQKDLLDSGIHYVNKALQIANLSKNQPLQADIFKTLSSIHQIKRNKSQSLEYLHQAKSIYEGLQMKQLEAQVTSLIGDFYYDHSMLVESEHAYLDAIEKLKFFPALPRLKLTYFKLGQLYKAKRNFSKAEFFLNKSSELERFTEIRMDFEVMMALGDLALKKHNYSSALSHYSSAYNRLERDNLISDYPEILLALGQTYSLLGSPEESVYYNNRYDDLKKDIGSILRRLEHIEKSQASDGRRLNHWNKTDQRAIIYYSISGSLVLILSLLSALKRRTINKQNVMLKKNIESIKDTLLRQKHDLEINTMNAVIEGQEKERSRIARDLHDRLGGLLSIVKVHFKSVEENIKATNEVNIQRYKEANDLLDQACDEVRNISHGMLSGTLVKFGLVTALEDLKTVTESTGKLAVNLVEVGFDARLKYEYELNLYRIIQELLSNTLKHAKATEFNVQLFKRRDQLNVVIEDDGIGFDPGLLSTIEGIGLKNIHSRVSKLEGELRIDSGLGAGTTITIDLPLKFTGQ